MLPLPNWCHEQELKHVLRQEDINPETIFTSESRDYYRPVHGWHLHIYIFDVGKLNLIDLAGNENVDKSGVGNEQRQEAIHINQSSCALSDVVHALNSRALHITYQNSRLTILQRKYLSDVVHALNSRAPHIMPRILNITGNNKVKGRLSLSDPCYGNTRSSSKTQTMRINYIIILMAKENRLELQKLARQG
jgi:hypothetical protein